ncbi:MAG: hypothetical protein L6Q81_16640 [Bacteroidia bacterium]|nr:hypothetical protein [Bacteroidia bacterium]
MGATVYNKAFELELSHLFYTEANKYRVNQQLDLFTTSATQELIRSGRMRMVRTAQGAAIFYQAFVDSSTPVPVIKPLIELTQPIEFVFALSIKSSDTYFLNTTDVNPGGSYSSGNVILLDGAIPPLAPPPATTPVDITLTHSLINKLRPHVFTETFVPSPITAAPLEVKVFAEGSAVPVITITGVAVNDATGTYSVEIDLNDYSSGIYTIEAKDGATLVHSAKVYVDRELSVQSVFAIVRLRYSDPEYFYKGLPDAVKYVFTAREVEWRYYVAIKSVPAGFFTNHTLELYDDNTPNPPVYTFSPLDGGGVPSSTVKINGMDTVIFTSDTPIAFSEVAIPRFKLKQNNPGPATKPLLSFLPNAAVSGVDSNQVGTPGESFAEIFLFLDQVSDP